jgi:hypothetical protein
MQRIEVTSETVSVTVEPLAVQINNGEAVISSDCRETEMLTTNVTGGVGPYTYTWYRYQYNPDTKKYEFVKVSNASSFTADTVPRQGHRVKVEVTDSTGTTVTTEIYIEVTDIIN